MQVNHGAGTILRPQRFAFSLGVMLNDGVCGVQNILRRAIILLLLYGESMGAATVMMTAGEQLPPQVKLAATPSGNSDR